MLLTCSRPNFGLKIELDPQNGRAYVLDVDIDVDAKSSAAKFFSSLKANRQVICLFYIVEAAGRCIFTKSEATTALSRKRDEGVCEFHITFAIEPTLTAKQRCHNTNELALFGSRTKWNGNGLPTKDFNCVNADFSSSKRSTATDHSAQSRVDPDTTKLLPFQDVKDIEFGDMCDVGTPQPDIVTLRAIAALQSGLDFSEECIPTDIILTVINSITSQAITPAEKALGKLTRRNCKNMDT